MQDLGAALLLRGLITERDFEDAQSAQRQIGGNLGLTLVRLGALAETDLHRVMAELWGLRQLGVDDLPDAERVRAACARVRVAPDWLRAREAVIWFAGEAEDGSEHLCIAARNPLDLALQEASEQWSAEPAQFFLTSQQALADLNAALDQTRVAEAEAATAGKDAKRLRELAEEAPVIDFVNAMFSEAIARRASDIHIEPFEDRFVVRLRIDGILTQWRAAPRANYDAVASRIKLLSAMDIAERRLPQDGRQSIRVSGREVDLRVSSLPTTWGESLVMRLLGKSKALPELSALGVAADHQEMLSKLATMPNGVVLVTGPTGSGKTTTIYRLLTQLNDGVRKIVTVEDPVEFDLPGVMQVQVKADIGLSFAAGLRSILRQDPDVIMVGEIRDGETARIAVQAALTGHLVISTVHTNSALAAAPRLMDLGVENYLLADVLRGVVGQRLARRLCRHCAGPLEEAQAAPFERAVRAVPGAPDLSAPAKWSRHQGCSRCGGTGYEGRCGVYEVIEIDGELQNALRNRRSEADLAALAAARGFRDMRGDGLLKARAGLTTMAEVARVVGDGDSNE